MDIHISIVIALNVINNANAKKKKTVEFANSVDLDEVAHKEPPHLGLHSFPIIFEYLI